MFSYELYEISKNTFFIEHLLWLLLNKTLDLFALTLVFCNMYEELLLICNNIVAFIVVNDVIEWKLDKLTIPLVHGHLDFQLNTRY